MGAPRDPFDGPAFRAAALLCAPFAALLAALAITLPASATQHLAADPLVQLLGRGAPWMTVAAAALLAVAYGRRAPLGRGDFLRAVAGLAAAGIVTLALRAVVGAQLPHFIPPEESSAPGVTLGLSAGLLEELVFRLMVLPGAHFVCRKRLGARASAAMAILATAVLFSLSHELGPAGGHFEARYLLTRFLLPGVGMSLAGYVLGPTFVVSAHCAAHLMLPALFHP